jgi:broad specificity phosphatase PhoE
MKLYILRHEDRTQDCSFFSPLTLLGLENAKKLSEHLKKENINLIFSSPFIRTLQTIYPYVKESGIKVNLEYSLAELHHEDIIAKQSTGIYLPEYIAQAFNYNPSYKSLIEPTNIKYPESEGDIKTRIKHFIKHLLMNYHNTDYNILLVTHESGCLNITEPITKIISSIDVNNYDKGKLTKIFENYDWVFNEIN